MYPVCKWLEAKHISRSIAITICLLIVAMLFGSLVWILGWQLSLFRQDVPELTNKIRPMLPRLQEWLRNEFSITLARQEEWLRQVASGVSGSAGQWLQTTLSATAGMLVSLMLIPIHAALFLYHRGTFVRFLYKVAGERVQAKLSSALKETVHTYFNYIKGMIVVYIIVGILNSIGLLALGVKHAILFGMLTAVMTIIPYVGIFVSASLPVAVSFITTDSVWYPIGVIFVFSFVQYLEANVIFPKVVGTQLNVSTWAMLMGIVVGGIIWGISGMILFIPFVAILKIISGHFEDLEAVNILLDRKQGHISKRGGS
jgi:predicted PurR-regulated permease PerM